MALQFQRNAKVFVELTKPSSTVWQIPVLAGFSFSQAMNSSEVTISEAGFNSRRARLLFNDSLGQVEWSMSTYIRPTAATSPTTTIAPEQVLWALLMGADGYSSTTRTYYSTQVGLGSPSAGNSPTASPSPFQSPAGSPDKPNFSFINYATSTSNVFDFSASNVASFPTTNNMYIAFEDGANLEYFTLSEAVVSSVTIDFDIEGIATAQWSGFARKIERTSSKPSLLSSALTDGISSTTNFIRNKISTITLSKLSSPNAGSSYNIVLTGGSFTVENNVSYLIPEQLGLVNQPIANVTGTRSISGTLTCYYDNNVANFASADLYGDMVSPASEVRNVFNLGINIGGAGSSTPRLQLQIPTAHLEIPTIGVDELLTLEVNFHGIVRDGDVDQTNEAAIVYLS